MFQIGGIYRHVNNTDVDILVVDLEAQVDLNFRMKIFWIRRNSGSLLQADRISIPLAKLSNWKRVKA